MFTSDEPGKCRRGVVKSLNFSRTLVFQVEQVYSRQFSELSTPHDFTSHSYCLVTKLHPDSKNKDEFPTE